MRRKKPATTEQKPTKLQRFGLFFFNRRETTVLLWLGFAIFGILSYTTFMQRQGFPNIDVPVSVVSGTYFVNDKNKVDTEVAEPASKAIASLDTVKKVSSNSGDNFFSIVVQYKDGTSSAEGNAQVADVLNTKKVLPSAAKVAFKAIDAGRFAEQSDLLLSVSSTNNLTPAQLQDRANEVANRMRELDGVNKVTVLTQVEDGVNPATGKKQSAQNAFDKIGLRDASGAVVFYNSATLGIQAKPETDALKLYDAVKQKIASLEQEDGFSDTRMTISADFAEGIRAQISNLQSSLLEGLLVVIVVSCLLISIRAGFATALSMATVLMMTVGALYASGTTLNTITLFALILSLGLIVDDTTIMVEAIDASNADGVDRRTVLAAAIKRVARASLSGTLTTMLAFAPMLFVGGILGGFIRILPISIIVALAVSLLVSLSLVPYFGHFLLHKTRKRRIKNPVAWVESYVSRKLEAHVLAGRTSRKKRIIYGGSALLFSFILVSASLPFFGKLKFDIFPNTKDSNQLVVTLKYPSGTTIDAASTVADSANIIIGDTLGKYIKRLSYENSGSRTGATVNIELIDYEKRDVKSPELAQQLRTAFQSFQGANIKVGQVDVGPPKDDFPFAVRIFDTDTEKSYALAGDIAAFLKGNTIKRLNGTTARITEVETTNSAAIVRSDNEKYVEVRAGFDATDVSALLNPAKKLVQERYAEERLAAFGLRPDQLRFDYGSEANNQDSFKSMVLAFPVLLGVMFILLVLQFRSFIQPLLIFAAIPYSFFGVAAGLYYTNNPMSFFVLVGFFALIGIAVNNTILLTDYANQAKEAGADKYEAVAQAVRARFRPLITTSLTSVVALIPLAVTDPFWQSLSVTLIFGLLSSTLLVVVAFPYLYLMTEWLRALGGKWWRRELPRGGQIVLDVLLWPVRLLRFLVWVIFSWPKTARSGILK